MISDWAIREALGMLREDPPLSLGGCVLAEALLPDERDILTRGQRLKAAFLAAIDSLQPAGERDVCDPRWWPYLIYYGVAVEGRGRDEMQQALSIAPTTYTRHRRRGFEWVRGFLPYVIKAEHSRAVGE